MPRRVTAVITPVAHLVGPGKLRVTNRQLAFEPETASPIRLHPHIGVIQEFVDSVREARPPKIGGPEGRAAVEICQACLLSSSRQEAVALPLS